MSQQYQEIDWIDPLSNLLSTHYDSWKRIHEAQINQNELEGLKVVKKINDFINKSEIIIANRYHPELDKVKDKVYTRDISSKD